MTVRRLEESFVGRELADNLAKVATWQPWASAVCPLPGNTFGNFKLAEKDNLMGQNEGVEGGKRL